MTLATRASACPAGEGGQRGDAPQPTVMAAITAPARAWLGPGSGLASRGSDASCSAAAKRTSAAQSDARSRPRDSVRHSMRRPMSPGRRLLLGPERPSRWPRVPLITCVMKSAPPSVGRPSLALHFQRGECPQAEPVQVVRGMRWAGTPPGIVRVAPLAEAARGPLPP